MLDTYWNLVKGEGRFWLDGHIRLDELSAKPGTLPVGSGGWNLYAKSGGLYYEDDNGVETGPLNNSPATVVTGTGAANKIAYWTGAQTIDDDTDLHWDASNNRLGIGTAAPAQPLHAVLADSGGLLPTFDSYSTASGTAPGGSFLTVRAARNTVASPAAVQTDDSLGGIRAIGYGTSFPAGAKGLFSFRAAETWNASNNGTYCIISTTPTGSSTIAERLRITAAGLLGIGVTPVSRLDVGGAAANEADLRITRTGTPGSVGGPVVNLHFDKVFTGADQNIFNIVGGARVSSTDRNGVAIGAASAEAWTAGTVQGSYLTFATTPTGSATRAERFRIGPSGQLGIGGATYGTSGHVLTSGGASAAPSWAAVPSGSIGGTITSGTATRLLYVGAGPVLAESANLTYDGSDLGLGSGTRARMQSQNRFRYLNSMSRVYRQTTNQTISNNTRTILLFNTEEFDTDTIHDTGSNTGRLTAKLAGKYLATCSVRWAANATGDRIVSIKKNGTTLISENCNDSVDANNVLLSGSPVIVSMAVNDYIEVEVYQDSGGDLDVVLDERTQFAMAYVGE